MAISAICRFPLLQQIEKVYVLGLGQPMEAFLHNVSPNSEDRCRSTEGARLRTLTRRTRCTAHRLLVRYHC